MAKGKANARAPSADGGSSTGREAPRIDPGEKINLYDQHALRNKLDSTVVDVILQAGYDEDVRPSNVRLTIGFAAIAIALYAQFGTGKFPRNWWPLAGCVAAYVLLTGLLNLYAHFTDRDVFFVSRPQPGSGLRLKASARMERYGEMYRLRFAALLPGSQPPGAAAAQRNGAAGIGKGASGAAGDAKAAVDVSFDASVAKFFHEDGYFAEAAFRKVVEGLILEFEAAAASGQSAKSE